MSPAAATEPDVVVVGAGVAGAAAALSAAESGAHVSLLEKQPTPGGSSVLSGGGFAFAGTERQHAVGIDDGPEVLRADFQQMAGDFADSKLIAAYVNHQLETYRWLEQNGVRFSSLQVGSGNSVARVHRTNPRQAVAALLEACARTGRCAVSTNVTVRRLVVDGSSRRVAGVEAEEAGAERTITARNIVLTTGGFSRSPEMLGRFAPSMLAAVPVGGDGSTGDGLRMACQVGAGLRDMGFIRGTFGSHPAATGANNMILLVMYKGAIIVNLAGRRFVNESLSYKDLGDACLAQPGQIAYQVFDGEIMAHGDAEAVTYDFDHARKRGLIIEAGSLDALAELISIDKHALSCTVAEYNEALAGAVKDPFGRRTLPGGGPAPPIAAPPFYAYPSKVALLSTYCGITINEAGRAVNWDEAPIVGLYAAGEITGGLHGRGYVSGSSLGKAAIMGRLAGRGAAGTCDRQSMREAVAS